MGENQARKRAECASSRKQGTPRANSTGQGGLVPQQRPLPDRPRARRGHDFVVWWRFCHLDGYHPDQ
jgi:hypothetical protein